MSNPDKKVSKERRTKYPADPKDRTQWNYGSTRGYLLFPIITVITHF